MNVSEYIVIMAGGSGERFWPLSTPERPKQFLPFGSNGESLIRMTCDRAAKVVGKENLLIATLEKFKNDILKEVEYLNPEQVVCEPLKRDTLGCIVWSMAYLESKHPNQNLTVAYVSADSYVGDETAYIGDVKASLNFAANNDAIITLGMKPSRPETGYGYLKRNANAADENNKIFPVEHFVEKPDKKNAFIMMQEGNYFWNCGSFIWNIHTFWNSMKRYSPEIYTASSKVRDSVLQGSMEESLHAFEKLPSTSIDYALAEKCSNIYVCPGNFVWDDVGSWDALPGVLKTDDNDNFIIGNIRTWGSSECVLINETDKALCTLGLNDTVVIQTEETTFVCPRSESQNVKKISQAMKADNVVSKV